AELAALLRVGLLQIERLRIPDHAAVAATVAAAPLLGLSRAKGLVNAVLRRFLREREALAALLPEAPAALYSHPQWLIDLLERDWPEDWRRLLEAGNAQPPMWLRVNLARTTRDAYRERLAAAGLEASCSDRAPGALLLAEPCPTASLPGYAEGFVSVQDAAPQLAAALLDLAPGQRVLDACAAPGGKTAHILESCPGVAELWALDRDPARLVNLRDNLDRLGLDARLMPADAAEPALWWDGRLFDRILLDAPCSALGVIRRHPDIKLLRTPDDIERAAVRQAALLAALWPLLAPGGRFVYATCTLARRENREQIEAFLAAHNDAQAPEAPAALHLEIASGEANMDGFYYACMDKQQAPSPSRVAPGNKHLDAGVTGG
ncbi:MAG TPA: 16S rRNA (cytosine(967)-C(5))-methyltransferase RsmB, partial [Gammaproteobacteria bacterium]|nr:16S rRNA (cytosine(967)-C(5))-methyltransferase RsmB [Gammaproteobacteria bacterium]